ncbi:MAG TPA: hypothetical protein VND45_04305 [Thermoanaerobaculia bacterium]|jgi:hypothetical protein|nr:hypothetical protein [Thermoanaerobaculia bacterium]
MRIAALALAAILVTACGSAGGTLGDLGSIILGSPSPTQPSDVRGSVDYVDQNARRIDLNVSYVNNLRSSGNDQRGSIYYTDNTRVQFEGKDYRVTDLERGDEIEVRGVNDNGRYVAEVITVTRDVTR